MKVFLTRVRLLFAVSAAAAFLMGACAGTSTQTPSPVVPGPTAGQGAVPRLTPTVPPAGLGPVERFAWQQVVQLGDAFAAGNAEEFLARVSRGFYHGYSTIEASVNQVLRDSSARSVVVAVRGVSEEEGKVSVRAEWTRSLTRSGGVVETLHGETVFLFLRSDTNLRLLDYRGAPPFGIPGI